MQIDDRKEREREYHDSRFGTGGRRDADRFYALASGSSRRYNALVREGVAGLRVLEYGCGPGSAAFDLFIAGAEVYGVDLSPVALNRARFEAEQRGLTVDFRVMDAEQLEFEDEFFDRVCGSGILHHLDLERAYAEVARVLKPNGTAVFLEPLGHNPLINAYRRRTPDQRTGQEHPLLESDIAAAKRHFGRIDVTYHHLTTLAAVPFVKSPLVEPLSTLLDGFDRALFAIVPPARRYAWFCVMQLGDPAPQGSA